MLKHVNIRVYGSVQGVFFRSNAQDEAQTLGIKGFVRNEDDGTVYLEAEGDTDNLEKLVTWCKEGPVSANINKVEVIDGVFKDYNHFDIRY